MIAETSENTGIILIQFILYFYRFNFCRSLEIINIYKQWILNKSPRHSSSLSKVLFLQVQMVFSLSRLKRASKFTFLTTMYHTNRWQMLKETISAIKWLNPRNFRLELMIISTNFSPLKEMTLAKNNSSKGNIATPKYIFQ